MEPSPLPRRRFAAAAGAAAMVTVLPRRARPADAPLLRAAVIGHTGRGNYGHGLDRVWLDVPGVRLEAVADADPRGLADAVRRLGGVKGFADYRRLLEDVKPDLVSVAPRWLDQHRDMAVAAAEGGVKGIYLEKPFCRTLAEADAIAAACAKRGVRLAIAHQTRYSPKLGGIRDLIRSGRLGRVLELRARGKEDARGGGEDLWVLGTHALDLMHALGCAPQSCVASVLQDGRPVGPGDVKPGNEGIGPLAGDEIHATYRLAGGATGFFDSVRGAGAKVSRFGLRLLGSKGVLEIHDVGFLPDVRFLDDPSWSPGRTGSAWVPVSSAGVGAPEPLPDGGLHAGNVAAVKDLIAAIAEDREPEAGPGTARTATEMIVAVFESHRVKGPVTFPLAARENPLTRLD